MGVRTYKAKQYSPAFVNRAIRLCEEQPDKPYSVIARDLDVEYATLYSWMKRAGKTKRRDALPPASSAAQTPAEMQAEIQRLHRELEETRKQLEFAKKAAVHSTGHRDTTTSADWLKRWLRNAGSKTRLVPKREG